MLYVIMCASQADLLDGEHVKKLEVICKKIWESVVKANAHSDADYPYQKSGVQIITSQNTLIRGGEILLTLIYNNRGDDFHTELIVKMGVELLDLKPCPQFRAIRISPCARTHIPHIES